MYLHILFCFKDGNFDLTRKEFTTTEVSEVLLTEAGIYVVPPEKPTTLPRGVRMLWVQEENTTYRG